MCKCDRHSVRAILGSRGYGLSGMTAGVPYYLEATACLLVYSVTSRASFRYVEDGPGRQPPDSVVVLVGNACDVGRERREVSEQEGLHLAWRLGCRFFEVSARTGENVEAAFAETVRLLVAKRYGGADACGTGRTCVVG